MHTDSILICYLMFLACWNGPDRHRCSGADQVQHLFCVLWTLDECRRDISHRRGIHRVCDRFLWLLWSVQGKLLHGCHCKRRIFEFK